MERIDYYSGELVNSPDFSQSTTNMNVVDSNSCGQINYVPGTNAPNTIPIQQQRAMNNSCQQMPMNMPSSYTYNNASYMNSIAPAYYQWPMMNMPTPNPYYNNGMMPLQQGQMMQYPYGYMQQYNNTPYYGNLGYSTVGGYGYNQGVQHPYGYNRPSSIHIKGPNLTGGETLYDAKTLAEVQKLQDEMVAEERKAQAENLQEQIKQKRSDYDNYGYDASSFLGWQSEYALSNKIQDIENKYLKKIEVLKQSAVGNRIDLNKRLSKLCRHYIGADSSDKSINDLYNGTDIPVTQNNYNEMNKDWQYCQFNTYLSRMQPVQEFQNPYYQHHLECQKFHDYYVNPKGDMQEFLHDLGNLKTATLLAEEDERRKKQGAGVLYDPNSFNNILADTIIKNTIKTGEDHIYGDTYAMPISKPNVSYQDDGSFVVNGKKYPIQDDFPRENDFSTLNECATCDDKGNISITLPERFGDGQGHLTVDSNISEQFKQRNQQILSGEKYSPQSTLSRLAQIVDSQRDGFIKALYGPKPKGGGYLEGYKAQ